MNKRQAKKELKKWRKLYQGERMWIVKMSYSDWKKMCRKFKIKQREY